MTVRDIEDAHVEMAIAEFDELGRQEFLNKYGYGRANTYLLRYKGRFYDPKGIIGAAHAWLDHQEALGVDDFDATQAIGRLRQLGFDVVSFNGLWWVNQGASYAAERAGGFVWAPQRTKSGRAVDHHVAVSRLRVGQLIVHYANGAVRAVGRVIEEPVERDRPQELSGDAWDVKGHYCRVRYHSLKQPIPREVFPNRGPEVGPFDVNGKVKQGYLFAIQPDAVFPMLEFLNVHVPELFDFTPDTPVEVGPIEPKNLGPDTTFDLLQAFKNVVLEGVPGTGKTFAIERLAREWKARTDRDLVQFSGLPYAAAVMHPSTTYEDFVEGLRPVTKSGESDTFFDEPINSTGSFGVDDGFIVKICSLAASQPHRDVLVLLDELNRCNVSSVFGDLLLTIEGSRRAVFEGSSHQQARARDWSVKVPARLPYSGRSFFVPDNVYIVATTNTTDRSVAPLDAALRRRFAFHRLEPRFPDRAEMQELGSGTKLEWAARSAQLIARLNADALGPCLGPDAMLGQSYVYAMLGREQNTSVDGSVRSARRHWQFVILPQLIDCLRSYGAEDLLGAETRGSWFGEHAELAARSMEANRVLGDFDNFLRELDLALIVEGTGLSRGARVVELTREDESLLEQHFERLL